MVMAGAFEFLEPLFEDDVEGKGVLDELLLCLQLRMGHGEVAVGPGGALLLESGVVHHGLEADGEVVVGNVNDVVLVTLAGDVGCCGVVFALWAAEGEDSLADEVVEAVEGSKSPEDLVVVVDDYVVEGYGTVVVGAVLLPYLGRRDLEESCAEAFVSVVGGADAVADEDDGVTAGILGAARLEEPGIGGGVEEDGVELALLGRGGLFFGRDFDCREDFKREVGPGGKGLEF